MTDEELISLNEFGFIPGPGELESDFISRVSKTKASMEKLNTLPRSQWVWAKERVSHLFDFDPQCLPVFYSNKNLSVWQGAACWIDEGNIPLLQLRNGFKKGNYLRLYSREEVLAHEAIHAARAAFNEEESEEFFAYGSSSVKWRSVLGPILKKPYEAWILMALLTIGVFSPWGILAATLWIGLGFFRLGRQHLRLARASNFLMGKVKEPQTARAVLFRLTDLEIRDLSRGIWLLGDESLRWRLLKARYLSEAIR